MDFLQLLRERNAERGLEWCKGDQNQHDSVQFRAIEFAGECGELLNVIKKIERSRFGAIGNSETDKELHQKLENEFGDVMITLDRLAAMFMVDIEECTVNKFNATSDKNRLSVKL